MTAKRKADVLGDFYRRGFALLEDVLTLDEVKALREAGDRIFDSAADQPRDRFQCEHSAIRLFEADRVFEEMIDKDCFLEIADEVLGDNCHLMAMNMWRTPPGETEYAFHVDGEVIFPLPNSIPRHDRRIKLNICFLTFQIPLCDLSRMELGPTEYIPESHYSGREPNHPTSPEFEGQKGEYMLCKEGNAYIHNGQCWHRPTMNCSNENRYLFQLLYAKRWVAQRFYPYMNYTLPDGIFARANALRRRVLGFHPFAEKT